MTTNTDTIRIVDRLLLVQFGGTGVVQRLSNLPLEGISFTKEGNQIMAAYNGAAPFLLESFPSEPLTATAFMRLQAALTRNVRLRSISMVGKGLIKWVVVPIALVLLVLALNMLATRVAQPPTPVATATAAPLLPLPASLDAIQQGMGIQKALSAPNPTELAEALSGGVSAKKYSVQLSQGRKGTIFVFSDPSCSHCQSLEGELEKLAGDYTIHIFPVSVIGKDASTNRVAGVLCQKPAARAALWKQIVGGAGSQDAPCADGLTATARNNEIFQKMGFDGTPVVINGAGEATPNYLENTAANITQWMSTSTRR